MCELSYSHRCQPRYLLSFSKSQEIKIFLIKENPKTLEDILQGQ